MTDVLSSTGTGVRESRTLVKEVEAVTHVNVSFLLTSEREQPLLYTDLSCDVVANLKVIHYDAFSAQYIPHTVYRHQLVAPYIVYQQDRETSDHTSNRCLALYVHHLDTRDRSNYRLLQDHAFKIVCGRFFLQNHLDYNHKWQQ
jgi:hypothetical protein